VIGEKGNREESTIGKTGSTFIIHYTMHDAAIFPRDHELQLTPGG
jgi:hypothetical protein